MTSVFSFLNRLLPFATPGTPVLQDLLHLAAICALLYFAPQIQDHLQRRNQGPVNNDDVHDQIEPPRPNQPAHGNLHEAAPPALGPQQNNEPHNVEPGQAAPNQDPNVGGPQWLANDGRDDDDAANDGQPGPANPAAAQRNVGAKKAKSLARRDQRRAYNEFMRSQGEAQRARDAEGAEERERAQAAERERRRAAEAALDAKKARERERRREQERKDREEEIARRERAVDLVRAALEEGGMCNLFDVATRIGGEADEVWLEKILRASGVLKKGDGVVTMVTSTGWVVRVDARDMAEAYALAASSGAVGADGVVTFEELGPVVERVVRDRFSHAHGM